MEEFVITHNRRRLGWVLVLTSTAYFMVALDATVVATALPRMQADLHVGLTSLQWTLNSYGIAFAAGIITAAALGDRYGRRLIFTIGLALFTVASAACALAPNVSVLIAARPVQGRGRGCCRRVTGHASGSTWSESAWSPAASWRSSGRSSVPTRPGGPARRSSPRSAPA